MKYFEGRFLCPVHPSIYPWNSALRASLRKCWVARPRTDMVGTWCFYTLLIASMISKITVCKCVSKANFWQKKGKSPTNCNFEIYDHHPNLISTFEINKNDGGNFCVIYIYIYIYIKNQNEPKRRLIYLAGVCKLSLRFFWYPPSPKSSKVSNRHIICSCVW